MKKFYTAIAALLLTVNVWAQAPQKMSYQAVIRNAFNALVVNQSVGMRISIIQGTIFGASVYVETQTPTTNANGLISIEIGSGNILNGNFSSINWANGPYFIKTETDPTGGSNYTITGTNQLLSVPYALHAKTASQLLNHNDADTSMTNELQTLSISNDTLFLTNGGFVKLPATGTGSSLTLPSLSTNPVSGITSYSATYSGLITNANGSIISEKGVVYSKTTGPTILSSNKITIGKDTGFFSISTSGDYRSPYFLDTNTQYYVRAYAITENNVVAYGNQVTFRTLNYIPPIVTTNSVTNINPVSAKLNGSVTNANGNQIISKGFVYSLTANPTIDSYNNLIVGVDTGYFYYNMNDVLIPNTTYFVRAYAISQNNIITYGNQVNFTTTNLINLNPVTKITSNSGTFSLSITNLDSCRINTTTLYVSKSPNINDIDSIVSQIPYSGSCSIGFQPPSIGEVLSPNTNYYIWVRAKVIGTPNWQFVSSNIVSFTTLTVGQTGPGGGKVFYDKGDTAGGWRYLEAAASDQSTGIQWGCSNISITGTQVTIGSGESNTALIVSGCNDVNFAAKLCYNLTLGGQTDWFLPSIDELSLMYKNLHLKNQGNFNTSTPYWSSTDTGSAKYFVFANGLAGGQMTKIANNYVRAIRAF
jgi:hypothetical protein